MAAYFEYITPAQCEAMIEGYQTLSNTTKEQLKTHYPAFLKNEQAQSPTYLPAVIKTALSQFKACGLTETKAMQNATSYTLTALAKVFSHINKIPPLILSARNAAFGKNWDTNKWAKNYLDGKISFCIAADNSLQTNRIT